MNSNKTRKTQGSLIVNNSILASQSVLELFTMASFFNEGVVNYSQMEVFAISHLLEWDEK